MFLISTARARCSRRRSSWKRLLEEVADLDADLGVLVRVEGGDAALGGAEGVAAQAGFLIGVLEDVIGQQELGPLRHDQVGGGDPGLLQGGELLRQLVDVQGHAVADDVGDVPIEHPGGQGVQGKAAVVVDDGVPCIGAPLEADHDVRLLCQKVGDLSLAFVAPVGAYDCFYHRNSSSKHKKTAHPVRKQGFPFPSGREGKTYNSL